jgi:hypothetical protein
MSSVVRREAVWLGVAVAVGLLVVPPVVYATGVKTLGAYAHGGLGAFLGDYYAALFKLQPAAWILAGGPIVALLVWRFLTRLVNAYEQREAT